MHIRKLEISGFKSFVDRTVVHFDEDVVGIVGPNGCGKSNIVDAIRWCMGEQSAKHLRGRSMSDVIFAGSGTRGPHGMAEVTLTFDNADPAAALELPMEYRNWSEIAVTRRLYRDGTSEYQINKTPVRLKDITDLFLGTGVGTKAYSIIEQGKIGQIVSARPEDRRLVIEEAAGITKYKARRKQAEQKMDATRQNLLRVGDIVSEIERNLASLKRQAQKAERYVAYKNELEDLVLHEASHKLLELIVRAQVQEAARAETTEAAQAGRAALGAREAELEVHRQAAFVAEDRAEKAQTAAFHADNEVRTHEADLARARDRQRSMDERRRAATIEREDLAKQIVDLEAERVTLEDALIAAEQDEASEVERARGEAEQLADLEEQRSAADATAQDLRRRSSEAQAAVAGAEATLTGHARRLADMTSRHQRLADEEERLRLEADELAGKRDALVTAATELEDGKRTTVEERERLTEEAKVLREQAVEQDRAVEQAKNVLGQKRNRLRALEEIHARHEGVGAGTKVLLASKDPSIVGIVADRVEASPELLPALAGLLGDRLQAVVVDDLGRGLALLGDLARANKGRASVVTPHPKYVAGAASAPLPDDAGVVGRLADRLRYAAEDEALVRALVGDAVVAQDGEAAARLVATGACVGAVVSLEGTVFLPDGTVRGGAGDAANAHLVEQRREMRELHEVVAAESDRVSGLLESQTQVRTRLAEVQVAVDRARNEAHQGELALVTAQKDLRRVEEQLAAAQRRLVHLGTELAELRQNLESVSGEEDAARAKLDEGRAAKEDVAGALEEAEERAAAWRGEVSRQQSVVTERKIALARVRERAAGVRGTVERIGRSVDEVRGRIVRLDDERESCAVASGESAARMWLAREQLIGAVERAQTAHEELRTARIALDELRAALGAQEMDLKGLRMEVGEAQERLSKHEMELARLEMERQHLLAGVAEKFRGLDLARVVGDYHKRPLVDAQHKARIGELHHLLDRMGPVNLDAMREHAEAEERFTYYKSQKDDLEKALDDLDKAIAQMNKETKRLFREAFEGINERFKVVFPKMFRGGTAELKLTNADDMMETGVEIFAQPPGKKLAVLEQMSGGEKALTAVSLIFAIFQFKPSPFCILDEVDAPLDEANVARYNEAIRSMTDRSQFILITHIKKTMQSVDVLYGVTMQEPGVSRLVSVRVNESGGGRRTVNPITGADAVASGPAAAVA